MVSKKSDQPDRRTLKTQHQLKDMFIKMLQDKPIDKITVTALAKACNIGRGTFYIHYKDVYDLYDSIVADTVDQLNEIFETLYPKNDDDDFRPLATSIVNFVVDHKPLFKALTNHGTNVQTLKQVNTLVAYPILESKDMDPTNTKYLALVEFASCGLIGSITDWVVNRPESQLNDLIHVIGITISAFRNVAAAIKESE